MTYYIVYVFRVSTRFPSGAAACRDEMRCVPTAVCFLVYTVVYQLFSSLCVSTSLPRRKFIKISQIFPFSFETYENFREISRLLPRTMESFKFQENAHNWWNFINNKCFHLLKERLAFCGRRPRADKIHVNSSSAEKSAKRPQFFSVCSSSVSESDWEGRVCAYPRPSNYKN